MRLEIGNFYVKDIKFGDKLSFDDGVLTINKEKALDFIREDERITEADLYIAKPGDKIRMCPVKEAIEPRVRLDGRGLFPGYTSELAKAGDGGAETEDPFDWVVICCPDWLEEMKEDNDDSEV